MDAGALIGDDLLQGAVAGCDRRCTASVSLHDGHREIFVALARNNQEPCALHYRQHFLPVELPQEPHANKL